MRVHTAWKQQGHKWSYEKLPIFSRIIYARLTSEKLWFDLIEKKDCNVQVALF